MTALHQEATYPEPGRRQSEKERTKEQTKRKMLDFLASGNNGASLLGSNPRVDDDSINFAVNLCVEYGWTKEGGDGEGTIESIHEAVREFINEKFPGNQRQKDARFNAATNLFRVKLVARLSDMAGNKPRNPFLPSADEVPNEYH